MSSTNRGGQRTEADNYPTPHWCVDRLLEHPDFLAPRKGVWYEPCAGEGALIQAINQTVNVTWFANEIREEAIPLLEKQVPRERITVGDYRTLHKAETPSPDSIDVIISNPPFRIAMDVIHRSLTVYPAAWLALLLRLNFWGSADRQSFMETYAPDTFVLPNRPPFKRWGKTDSPEYAWFCWGPSPRARSAGLIRVLKTTPLDVRRAASESLMGLVA